MNAKTNAQHFIEHPRANQLMEKLGMDLLSFYDCNDGIPGLVKARAAFLNALITINVMEEFFDQRWVVRCLYDLFVAGRLADWMLMGKSVSLATESGFGDDQVRASVSEMTRSMRDFALRVLDRAAEDSRS